MRVSLPATRGATCVGMIDFEGTLLRASAMRSVGARSSRLAALRRE